MSPFDLIDLLRERPFKPFRIFASDGRTYDIRHPDQALVLVTRVVLPVPGAGDVPERLEHLALSHIVRVEELSPPMTAASSPAEGTT